MLSKRICPLCASHVARGIRLCSSCGADLKRHRPLRSKAAKDKPAPLWKRFVTSPWMLLVAGLGGFGLLFLGARQDVTLAQAYSVADALFVLIGFVVLLWMRTRGDFFEVVLTLRFNWVWLLDDESDGWLIAWLAVVATSSAMWFVLKAMHGAAMHPWS